jgi:hypothetical protein
MHLEFYCLWIPGFIFQVLLLMRGFRSSWMGKFPFFYSYIAAGTTAAILGLAILLTDPVIYRSFYWIEQFVTLIVGCGLVLEIFDHVLSAYPGARKLARKVCLVTFGTIIVSGLAYANLIRSESLSVSEIQLERDIRCAQVILFVAIVAVVYYYRVSLTRNTQGMIQGYGIYLGVSLSSLALRSYVGPRFNEIWNLAQPMSFDLALLIWVIAFWVYQPSTAPERVNSLDLDYAALASFTRSSIGAVRSHLARAMRN